MTDERPTPYAWYVLGVLFVYYVFNFLDRSVIGLLVDGIKADLEISDTQIGFLTGPAFSLCFALAGIPLARLADVWVRRSLMAIGIGVWSLMTIASGMAQQFWHLAFTRMGLAVAEATGVPPAHSLLSDYFSSRHRTIALSVFSLAYPVGAMLAFMAGGFLIDAVGWRWTFILLGAPGLLIAVVLRLTVREPVRGRFDTAGRAEQKTNLREVTRVVFRKPAFVWITLGFAGATFFISSYLAFVAPYLGRVHRLSGSEIGLMIGIGFGAGGLIGTWSGGYLANRLSARSVYAFTRVPACAMILATPLLVWFCLSDRTLLLLPVFLAANILFSLYMGPTYAMYQSLARPNMRATTVAIASLINNLLGAGLGPQFVGYMSDVFAPAHGIASVRYALALASLSALFSGFCYLMASRTLRRDLESALGAAPL